MTQLCNQSKNKKVVNDENTQKNILFLAIYQPLYKIWLLTLNSFLGNAGLHHLASLLIPTAHGLCTIKEGPLMSFELWFLPTSGPVRWMSFAQSI